MDDRVLGGSILVGSILGIIIYFYLTFLSPWVMLIIQISAFVAVTAVLLVVAWIGYTLATTPPLTSIEEAFEEETATEEQDQTREGA